MRWSTAWSGEADLLTSEEELDRANVFDVELLARRLVEVIAWLRVQPETRDLPVGYFGASTGAAAALWAAGQPQAEIAAAVSRRCRLELARGWFTGHLATRPRLEGQVEGSLVPSRRVQRSPW